MQLKSYIVEWNVLGVTIYNTHIFNDKHATVSKKFPSFAEKKTKYI